MYSKIYFFIICTLKNIHLVTQSLKLLPRVINVLFQVSFFIPPEIVQARIVLLVTLCLVLINMFNSTM
jgi:hypothetical protein